MRLPVVYITAFWKWFWFACAALSLKGPQFVEIVGVLQLPAAVHLASFVVGLAGLLLTLQIHPTPTPAPPSPPAVSGQRGFVGVRTLFVVAVLGGVALAVAPACKDPITPATLQTVLTDEQYACVTDQIVNSVLPVGPPEQVASFIQDLCKNLIPTTLTGLIVNFINALQARAGDAGLTHYLLSHRR